jgi:hypothetical protein
MDGSGYILSKPSTSVNGRVVESGWADAMTDAAGTCHEVLLPDEVL